MEKDLEMPASRQPIAWAMRAPPFNRRSLAAACATMLVLTTGTHAAAQSSHKRKSATSSSHALVLKFQGSPEEFDAALKRNFAIRAKELGVDPSLYTDELGQVHDIVATCMTVTASDWRAADSAFTNEMHYVSRSGGINPVIRRIQRLKNCDGSAKETPYFGEQISDASRPRKLGVVRSMSAFNENAQKVPTPYFSISVSFWGLPEDKDRWTLTSTSQIPEHYEVIEARIPRNDGPQVSQASNSPSDCIKPMNRFRDAGLDYIVVQNTCDQPYRVNANTRSGKVITAVVNKGGPVRLMAVVSMTGGFTGGYSVDAP
jgi:hypothetical protein